MIIRLVKDAMRRMKRQVMNIKLRRQIPQKWSCLPAVNILRTLSMMNEEQVYMVDMATGSKTFRRALKLIKF